MNRSMEMNSGTTNVFPERTLNLKTTINIDQTIL